MKQTAVEFLVQELRNGKELNDNLIGKANKVFEQQLKDAYVHDRFMLEITAELYYNETFKNK
jgi:hypothetical protein